MEHAKIGYFLNFLGKIYKKHVFLRLTMGHIYGPKATHFYKKLTIYYPVALLLAGIFSYSSPFLSVNVVLLL